MVMFRDFVQQAAEKLNIVGTVRNTPNEKVSIIAEGEEEALRKFLAKVKQGPSSARVDRVEEVWGEPLDEYKSFDIIY